MIQKRQRVTILNGPVNWMIIAGIVTADYVKIRISEDLEKTGFFIFHFDILQDTRFFAIYTRSGL